MKDEMTFINWLQKPIAVLRIRAIQRRYKRLTIEEGNSCSFYELLLLQAKEEYYRHQFDSWGKYHPKFSYSPQETKDHHAYLDKIFPKKDFKEDSIVVWHKYDAVTYYHNKIYKLSKGGTYHYSSEILKQIKKWNK